MTDEPHAVVRLLLKRMESHPEEFGGNDPSEEYISQTENDRWWQARTLVMDFGTEEEKAAVAAALRKIKLDVAHQWMMEELCNGDERRRKEQEEREKEMQLRQQMYAAQQQMYSQQNAYAQQSVLGVGTVNNALSQVGLGGANGYQNVLNTAAAHRQYYDAATDTYHLGNGLTMTKQEVADNPGFVASMKKALGL